MSDALRKVTIALLCAVGSLAWASAPASAEPVLFYASLEKEGPANGPYPPGRGFEGPCGAAVDANGVFYVADYYHDVVDAFTSSRKYLTQAVVPDQLDGPCGVALDAAGALYVNKYHREILKLAPSSFPLHAETAYQAGEDFGAVAHATGVGVDPVSGEVYVDEGDRISVFQPSGQPVLSGGSPLQIGVGSLEEGYGLALSQHPTTAGFLYVADAASDRVKVYDPSLDVNDPVAEIDGQEGPGGGFTSLRDSAVAVDRVSGDVYVADNLQPVGFERPKVAIDVFGATGIYTGRLPIDAVDPRPPGIAVDNSATGSRGRVYVTTGNTEIGAVYIYNPKTDGLICTPGSSCEQAFNGFAGIGSVAAAAAGAPVDSGDPPAAASGAPRGSAIAQKGTLRLALSGSLSPARLPRREPAPVAVTVAGKVSTTDQSPPPQLKTMRIELNRHGRLDFAGLPTCSPNRIATASSARALAACRGSLVGRGGFDAEISLGGQAPYPTQGELLVFNGVRHGRPVLYGHLYAPRPFATSFVITFAIQRIHQGDFGTALTAQLPEELGSWGNLTGIEMRLSRQFSYRGRRHSFLSASCPAPVGFPGAVFTLARADFRFSEGKRLQLGLTKSCQVAG